MSFVFPSVCQANKLKSQERVQGGVRGETCKGGQNGGLCQHKTVPNDSRAPTVLHLSYTFGTGERKATLTVLKPRVFEDFEDEQHCLVLAKKSKSPNRRQPFGCMPSVVQEERELIEFKALREKAGMMCWY